MIPKIIHYCWFGNSTKSELNKKCIESWKKYCPDYEIKEWNESNFDINMYQYTKEAHNGKKWAFVSDVARLYALHTEGGIYLDTDMELCKPIDELLKLRAFTGFTPRNGIMMSPIGSEKQFSIFEALLKTYQDRHFKLSNGKYDDTVINEYMEKECLKFGFELNNQLQEIQGFKIFPYDYFDPKDYYTQKLTITPNTYAIHHAESSWLSKKQSKRLQQKRAIYSRFGNKWGKQLCKFPGKLLISLYIYIENLFFKLIGKN